ncbi:hypothetical protein RTG_02975 [Rhodotorula toruloides ATCC 204091]|uniref:Uncharacterized protein n=1 Tax=Rhodotorula toruloides TaxID=5286 RepID=A0A0K3CKI5_RHOTO|nr:hypothetical protein RTG_02975 [Rhodotorula toruloides ATCC 204091]
MAAIVSKLKSVVSPNHTSEQGAHPPATLHALARTNAASKELLIATSRTDLRTSLAAGERGRHAPAHPSHLNPDHEDRARSASRGRGLVTTGRGGAGNMSRSRARDADSAEEAAEVAAARSRSRSRVRAQHHGEDLPVAAGRGGLGNVRGESKDARSREREAKIEEEDKEAEVRWEAKHKADEHLTGRGGLGNREHR